MAPILVQITPGNSIAAALLAETDDTVGTAHPAGAPPEAGKTGLPSGSVVAGPVHRDATGHIVATEQKSETCDRAAPVNLPLDKKNVDILMLGASIIEQWNGDVLRRHFSKDSVVNAGVGGWTTKDVLGMLSKDGLKVNPRLIILLAISNDLATGRGDVGAAVENIRAITRKLCSLAPTAKVLLLAVLPRGEAPTDPLRAKIKAENQLLVKIADSKFVYFLDVGSVLLRPNGELPQDISGDYAHLTERGYELLTTAIQPTVEKLLAKSR